MKEKGNDELSVLMDGEATELEMHRVLRNVAEDPAAAAKWQRYHLASAILKKEIRPCHAQTLLNVDLASRVRAALEEEPVIVVAPTSATIKAAARNAWWKPLANVGIAASVAFVVVIGWKQAQPAPAKPVVAAPQFAQSATPAPVFNASINNAPLNNVVPVQYGNAVPVSQSFGAIPRGLSVPNEFVRFQRLDEERFNHYLISHSGNAAFATQGGQLPYVRVVTLKPVDAAQH